MSSPSISLAVIVLSISIVTVFFVIFTSVYFVCDFISLFFIGVMSASQKSPTEILFSGNTVFELPDDILLAISLLLAKPPRSYLRTFPFLSISVDIVSPRIFPMAFPTSSAIGFSVVFVSSESYMISIPKILCSILIASIVVLRLMESFSTDSTIVEDLKINF